MWEYSGNVGIGPGFPEVQDRIQFAVNLDVKVGRRSNRVYSPPRANSSELCTSRTLTQQPGDLNSEGGSSPFGQLLSKPGPRAADISSGSRLGSEAACRQC